MRITVSVLFSLLTLGLMGCPKEQTPAPTDGPNPRYEFVSGVKVLQKPDRKTGEYDYETAYNHFLTATQLDPNFAEAHYNAAWTAEKMDNIDAAINDPFWWAPVRVDVPRTQTFAWCLEGFDSPVPSWCPVGGHERRSSGFLQFSTLVH